MWKKGSNKTWEVSLLGYIWKKVNNGICYANWKKRLPFNKEILSWVLDPKSNEHKTWRGGSSQISKSRRTKYLRCDWSLNNWVQLPAVCILCSLLVYITKLILYTSDALMKALCRKRIFCDLRQLSKWNVFCPPWLGNLRGASYSFFNISG